MLYEKVLALICCKRQTSLAVALASRIAIRRRICHLLSMNLIIFLCDENIASLLKIRQDEAKRYQKLSDLAETLSDQEELEDFVEIRNH